MSSLADLGFTENYAKVPDKKYKIKQLITCGCLIGTFLIAMTALGLVIHYRSTDSTSDTNDSASAEQVIQDAQTQDAVGVALPEGSLYGSCNDSYNKCENQATCLMAGPKQDHHLCLCTSLFYGRFCQHKIIPHEKSICNDTVCDNSGTCIDVGGDEYACLCQHGYHGKRCQDKITWPLVKKQKEEDKEKGWCYKGMCLNDGTCIDVNKNDFACLCQYGYKGSRCEQAIEQQNTENTISTCNECENQGTCLRTNDGFACLCKYGFFGASCQHGIKSTSFRVSLSKWENVNSNKKTIKWDRILLNPGGCYDQSTGAYKAMVSGVYQFSVQKYGNNKQGSFNVLLDSTQIIYTRHKDTSERFHSASSTFMLHLDQGQQLQVQNEISTIVYGTHGNGYISSWFQGHLLYPD